MASALQDPDYKNNFFQYPELTRIHGEPTTAALLTLRKEVKANALTVFTTLGGGAHGHLGLVVDANTYATIPNTVPYVRPVHPGPLVLAQNATQYQIILTREQHQEAMRLFREANAVERALIQQIVSAIDDKFLRAIRDKNTNSLIGTIPQVFDHLFSNYGHVTRQELSELKKQVEDFSYQATDPVDVMLAEVDDLSDIAEIAKSPISDAQKVDMAYLLLQRTTKFSSALTKWNEKADADKTWDNFKKHARDAQLILRNTGQLTVQESMNQTEIVNLVSEGVRQALAEHTAPENTDSLQEQANSVQVQDPMQAQLNDMRNILQQVQSAMAVRENPQQAPAPPAASAMFYPYHMPFFNPYHMAQMPQFQGGFPPNQQHHQQNKRPFRQRFYCWTHGACSHKSKNCKHKATGHKDNATFENRMGGSNRNLNM